jgi:hypothetical protein
MEKSSSVAVFAMIRQDHGAMLAAGHVEGLECVAASDGFARRSTHKIAEEFDAHGQSGLGNGVARVA